MKDYTIVYADYWQSGSHTHSITKVKTVQGADVREAVSKSDLDPTQVWFVFAGKHEVIEDWTQ